MVSYACFVRLRVQPVCVFNKCKKVASSATVPLPVIETKTQHPTLSFPAWVTGPSVLLALNYGMSCHLPYTNAEHYSPSESSFFLPLVLITTSALLLIYCCYLYYCFLLMILWMFSFLLVLENLERQLWIKCIIIIVVIRLLLLLLLWFRHLLLHSNPECVHRLCMCHLSYCESECL